jgi:alkyldihydroxyacetonephosphate synthase
VKGAIQQAFMDLGATLSHHHAVGVEHQRWLDQDISPAGVAMVQALLDGVDPAHNLNPGKIVASAPADARVVLPGTNGAQQSAQSDELRTLN